MISIIIPTLNNTNGLKYLLKYFQNFTHQLIIIDNQPTIEKKLLIKNFQKLYKNKLIYLPQNKNLGFASSINLGAKYSKNNWLLILNDDIEFQIPNFKNQKDILKNLILFAEKNNLQATTPILVNPDGSFENLGYQVLPFGKVKLIKDLNDQTEFDGITAACLLIKKQVFEKLKGFDESFFAYLEDVDFFIRFRKKGYQMAVAKHLFVFHHHQTTSKIMGNFKARQDMINWWRLYFKHQDKFKFDFQFIKERLKNISGFIKTSFKITNNLNKKS